MIINVVIAAVLILGAVFGIVNERSMARHNHRASRRWLLVLEGIVILGGAISLVLAIIDLIQQG